MTTLHCPRLARPSFARMPSRARLLTIAGGAVLGLAGIAQAVPALLEQLPDNAAIVFTIPSPSMMEKDIQAFATATEAPIPPMGISDLLGMGGFVQGVAADKAMALVMVPPTDPKAEFDPSDGSGLIMLMPTTGYADLLANFEGKASGGTDELKTPSGETMFMRDLKNGYAAIGKDKATIDAYKAGKADAVTSRAGKAGMSLIDSADIVAIINMEVLRPHMDKAVNAAKAKAKDAMKKMPVGGPMGDADPTKELDTPLAKWVQERVSTDTRMIVGGIKLSSMGARLDMSASFVEGSYLAKMFSTDASAGALLKNLPNEPYLLVMALDTSSAAMKSFFADFSKKAQESQAAKGEEMPQMMIGPSISKTDGQATLVGFNPMMIMGGGALSSTISYSKSSKPDELVADVKRILTELDGFDNDDMSMASKFTEKGAAIGAAKLPVDTWEVKLTPKNPDPQIAQAMAMMFGPAGKPAGYLAKTDGGVYMTYASNSQLLEKALSASKGDANLSKDPMIMQVGEMLPSGRIAEAYLGTKSIMDTALPLMGMMGVQLDPASVPTELPPLGASIAAQQGSAQITLFVPAPVLKVGATVAMKLQEAAAAMEGMGEGSDEDATDNDDNGEKPGNKPAGQPSF